MKLEIEEAMKKGGCAATGVSVIYRQRSRSRYPIVTMKEGEMKTVTTQSEFEAYLERGERSFVIDDFIAVLWDSTHAVLWGSSHVELWDSSLAVLWDSSHAVLRDFASAHVKGKNAKAEGTPRTSIITVKYPSGIAEWCRIKGVKPLKQRIRLWKCVRKDGSDFHTGKIHYDTNRVIVPPDWEGKYEGECGHGLHLADSPSAARLFVDIADLKTARLFQVSAHVDDLKCFPGLPQYPMKLRAKKCRRVKEYPIDYRVSTPLLHRATKKTSHTRLRAPGEAQSGKEAIK